ncbi:MAG: GNAT family N-acetyltransferase [Traorella sp.]
MIRKAEIKDLSRIAEILVFVKRLNFRRIFHNDDYSFNELQVIRVADEYQSYLKDIYVYDDGIVKGLIHIQGKEAKTLYVDSFFESQGIGGELIEFAKKNFGVDFLWALEKNERALKFYERHGFRYCGIWKYEEGTSEKLLCLKVS